LTLAQNLQRALLSAHGHNVEREFPRPRQPVILLAFELASLFCYHRLRSSVVVLFPSLADTPSAHRPRLAPPVPLAPSPQPFAALGEEEEVAAPAAKAPKPAAVKAPKASGASGAGDATPAESGPAKRSEA
jgi:hypothetical protein